MEQSSEIDASFLRGGGESGDLIRKKAWGSTEMGDPKSWPEALKSAIRLMLMAGHPMVVLSGPNLRCLYNDAFRRLLGPENHPALLGMPARDALRPSWAAIGADIESVIAGRGPLWRENQHVPVFRRGRIRDSFWTFSLSALSDTGPANEVGVLAICVETTAQAAAAKQAETLASSFRDADARKDEFMAVLAHELRNPLAPIRNATAVLKDPRDTTNVGWAAAMIERQVSFMAKLLDDLLDISRISRGTLRIAKRSVPIREVLDAAIEIAQPAMIARGHTLKIHASEHNRAVFLDPLRISQALANLLSNAAKYTPEPSQISLTVELVPGQITFTISDPGLGLDVPQLQEVFEMFKQVKGHNKHADGGLGVGLALVRGIAHLHGGTVTASSRGIGKGSSFQLSLPSGRSEQPSVLASALSSASNEGATVIVAGGNRESVRKLGDSLAASGCTVHLCSDDFAVVEIARRILPSVLLIDFTDGVPFDFYQVALKLKSQPFRHSVKLIGISHRTDEHHQKLAAAAGFDVLLANPNMESQQKPN